jgi:hypothetical protein
MYKEEDDKSFIKNLSTKYKKLIYDIQLSRLLISKNKLKKDDLIITGYIDHTSSMIMRSDKDEDLCIMKIPPSFYNYFVGKNGVMKIKHENMFNISITEMDNNFIRVEGENKKRFKKYVLDKIYNLIKIP